MSKRLVRADGSLSRIPRLVALDVDGTVLTSDHRVTAGVRTAIERVRGRGVQIVLATSRPPVALWPVLDELGMYEPAVFIGSQGAVTGSFTAQGVLHVHASFPMPLSAARAAVSAGLAQDLAVNWFTAERWLVSHRDAQVDLEARIVGVDPQTCDLLTETAEPHKLLLIAPPSAVDRLGVVAGALPAELRAQTSNFNYLEITSRAVDKAAALRRFCVAGGIPLAEVAAMGDGMNDLGMLAVAGFTIAPTNAHPAVLAAVDLVTASNDADAVALALAALVPE
ncbi:MAG: HAD-IIB family hydrolase [Candidatus Nanopelagicales bacterium]